MLGDQTVRPRYQSVEPSGFTVAEYLARNSVLITSGTSWINGASKVAARPIACGNTVAIPARATPCRPSFHQLYSGTPRRGIAGAVWPTCAAFSSSVRRETKSFTRCSVGSFGFLYCASAGGAASSDGFAATLACCANIGEGNAERTIRNVTGRIFVFIFSPSFFTEDCRSAEIAIERIASKHEPSASIEERIGSNDA